MSLKELKAFLKLCRKSGVTEITFQDVHVKLGDAPKKEVEYEQDEIEVDSLTEEQLIDYHITGQVG